MTSARPDQSPRTPSRTVLHERPRTTVYLDSTGAAPAELVILKVLNDPHPAFDDLTRCQRDLAITRGLDVPGIRRGLRMDRVGGRHALVLEYAPGQALAPRVVRGASDVADFLRTALAAARVLGAVHDRGVVHKDVKPGHLIHDSVTGAVTLIDFGIASRLELQASDDGRPESIEGTLAYIAPEQTGRTNRVVDWRADLYSLGATFYALLAGRPPWTMDDAGELVHAHLARVPDRLDLINPAVPAAIADIVEKLLAKDADDRYQSARGLAHDLERCLVSLERDGRIEPFALAAKDSSGRLHFPAKLYGRLAETESLLDAFARVRAGPCELALVSGDAGVGKSSMVHELDRPIAERGGLFVEGKFDQLRRSVPYSALAQAFRQLVDKVLTEPDAAFGRWRDAIGGALGASGAALLPLVPTLERVLGPLPALGDAASAEVQNRFRSAAQAFVRAVCAPERPLVLFLDDLQWADMASLEVLRWIVTDPNGAHLLIVGAYRASEVPSGHPLRELLEAVRVARLPTHALHLDDLAFADVRSLVADTLHVSPEAAAELAALVHGKTRGNPFFVRRFIQSLYDDGHLDFDGETLRWRWDVESIAALNVTDNVVDLVAAQLGRLAPDTRDAVETAACVGGWFDLSTLSAASGHSATELQRRLWPAVEAGLLLPRGRAARHATGADDAADVALWSYAFVHDRVQQAAYGVLDAAMRAAAHLRIGRSLLARTPPEQRDERIFEIAHHLDAARHLIVDGVERREVAELNLAAGRRAAASAAYGPAAEYLAAGLSLLGENAWNDAYALALPLASSLGEARYLGGALDEADRVAGEVVQRAHTALDAFTARETCVMVAYARDRQDLALAHGRDALRALGIRFPAAPTMASVVADMARTKWALRGRVIESLAELPATTDASTIAAMQLIERIIPAAFRSGSKIFPLLVFRLVRLSVRRGNGPVSSFGYSAYAISLCGVLGDYDAGYRFALVGQRVAERFNAPTFRAKALFVFGNFVRHWKEPLAECIEPLAQSWRFGMESGAQFEAIWATFYRLLWSLQAGRELTEVARDITDMEGLLAQDAGAADAGRLLRQAVANLSTRPDGDARNAVRLGGPHYDEATMQARHAGATDQTHLCFYHALKLQLAVWFGDVAAARRHAEEAERRIEAVTSMPYVPIIRFYAALAAIDALAAQPHDRALERIAAKRERLLAKWARRSPANYRHKQLLIAAERARAAGDMRAARDAFDAAVSAAKQSGLVHEEAFVLERAGAFYHATGQDLIAGALVNESVRAWRHWGADAKVAWLEHEFPALVARGRGAGVSAGVGAASVTAAGGLDLAAMTKAAGAISGVGDRLLERLVAGAVESGGATRGALITAHDDELTVAAVHTGATDAHAESVELVHRGLDAQSPLCDAAVRVAARTRHALVVDDARADPRFRDHPWISGGVARAMLCVPIILRERLSGVLYLENTAPGSFTPDRVEVLTVLGGEAAIALENARLFDAQVRLTEAQKRFVPHEFLRSLDRTDISQVALGDAIEKTMSVLFADMRGFSTLIEGMTPAESIRFINGYLGELEPSITTHRGFVDEYQGDGILALFDTAPDDAVRAALDMLNTLETMNARREASGGAPIRIGIGINTGRLILGTIGGETHLKAGVVGDTVNLSARIESLTKVYDVPLLVGGELVSALSRPSDFALRALDTVRVVGRTTPVTLYEVIDADPTPRRGAKHAHAEHWNDARDQYRARNFAAARALAAEFLARVPDDRAAARLVARCERYIADPPPAHWTAVEDLETK
jgi:predicted ATPase/class 3 adenylate cyclase